MQPHVYALIEMDDCGKKLIKIFTLMLPHTPVRDGIKCVLGGQTGPSEVAWHDGSDKRELTQ